MNLNEITSLLAAQLAPALEPIPVFAEVESTRDTLDPSTPSVVVLSGPSSEVGSGTFTYKARIEIVLYFQPDAVENYDESTPDNIAAAADSLFESWTLSFLPSLPVYLYEAKRLPTVAKKLPLQYEYHIPYTLFLQF